MTTPGFSLAAIPSATLMALGQAFAVADDPETTPAQYYDQALYHLMTYWGGTPTDEDGVAHLAKVMKYCSRLMGHAAALPQGIAAQNPTMQNALLQGLMHNQSSQKPAAEPEPPPQHAEPEQPETPKPKMTADGFVIIPEFVPGEHLSSDQARERAGIGKSQLSKLLQAGEFVRPLGVVVMASGQRAKVYSADDVDRWKAMRTPTGQAKREPNPEASAKRLAAMQAQQALPVVDWSEVRYGTYWDMDKLLTELGCSNSHVYMLQAKGVFPKPTHRGKDPHAPGGMMKSLYKADDITHWIATSTEPTAFRARKRRAAESAGTAAEPDPERPQPAPVAAAPADEPPVAVASKKEPEGWLNLRDVAAYLGVTETGVERMVRDKQFPPAARYAGKFKTKEWGARQVVKWRRDHQTNGALTGV